MLAFFIQMWYNVPMIKTGYFNRVRFEERQIGDAEIIIARFPNPSLFVLSLLRVSEFKECIVHSGKVFSNTRYRTWFRSEHNGFDYEDFVLGMNLPDTNFKNFYETFYKANGRNKINRFEKSFIALLQEKGLVKMNNEKLDILKKFYVIVLNDYLNDYLIDYNETNEDINVDVDQATLKHEMSHALYYVSQEYRDIVAKAWASIDEETRKNVIEFMKEKHYSDDVIVDEFGAYVTEPYDNHLPVDKNKYLKAISEITECFQRSVGEV